MWHGIIQASGHVLMAFGQQIIKCYDDEWIELYLILATRLKLGAVFRQRDCGKRSTRAKL